MNKSKAIPGIICLLVAALLAVLNLTLSPENLMFQVGDQNMPWVPPVVLGIIGIILLAVAIFGEPEEQEPEIPVEINPQKEAANKRLETIAWGLFLGMLGCFLFVPEEIIRGGWWSIGVGLIMLGLNAARYFSGLRMSAFTTVLGVLSVIGGVLDLVLLDGMNWPVLLIVLGCYLVLKPWFEKRDLFGKAEAA